MTSNEGRQALTLDQTGIYRIRSTSRTVCYVDLDRLRFYRDRGPGSQAFPHDGEWVPLVAVTGVGGERDVIRVGQRTEYLTDPDGGLAPYRWYIPQLCVAIELVDRSAAPTDQPAGE